MTEKPGFGEFEPEPDEEVNGQDPGGGVVPPVKPEELGPFNLEDTPGDGN